MPQVLVNAKQLAEMLGVTKRQVMNWLAKGKITGYRPGRAVLFDVDEVREQIKAFRVTREQSLS